MQVEGYCKDCGHCDIEIYDFSASIERKIIKGVCCECGKITHKELTNKQWKVFVDRSKRNEG